MNLIVSCIQINFSSEQYEVTNKNHDCTDDIGSSKGAFPLQFRRFFFRNYKKFRKMVPGEMISETLPLERQLRVHKFRKFVFGSPQGMQIHKCLISGTPPCDT